LAIDDLVVGEIEAGLDMTDQQLDFFACASVTKVLPLASGPDSTGIRSTKPANALDDAELIARIPLAGIQEAPLLAKEAGRRKLLQAVPVLAALCRRFAGFGLNRRIPEQEAALEALGMIGGREAKDVVSAVIVKRVVQGPSLPVALAAAASLKVVLPNDTVMELLLHEDGQVRSGVCRCATAHPRVMDGLATCLKDHDPTVRIAAACALGQMGRKEVRFLLTRQLEQCPSLEVIDAITPIADEDCIVLLGRIARTRSELRDAVLDAFDMIDLPAARNARLRLAHRPEA
jgi:hypothetical protein